jgi:hypothetical protein
MKNPKLQNECLRKLHFISGFPIAFILNIHLQIFWTREEGDTELKCYKPMYQKDKAILNNNVSKEKI